MPRLRRFQLFRIKVFEKPQRPMFGGRDTSRPLLIRRAIAETPPAELRENEAWCIGDIDTVDENGLFFKFGKLKIEDHLDYDKDNKKFFEDKRKDAIVTDVLVDPEKEILIVSSNSRLAHSPKAIVSRITEVFNSSQVSRECEIEFHIDIPKEPDTFIEIIKRAYSLRSISLFLQRPNPFLLSDFIGEGQKAIKDFDATEGEFQMSGKDLNTEKAVEVARIMADIGQEMKATIKSSEDSGINTVFLSHSSNNIETPPTKTLESLEEKRQMLEWGRSQIERVPLADDGEKSRNPNQ